jgi:Cu-Zn family superoxide dismutase
MAARIFFMIAALSVMVTSAQAQTHDHHDTHEAASAALDHASATLYNADKDKLGTVVLIEGTQGVLAKIDLQDVPQGWHAIHFHGSGHCNAADFSSAGGHAVHIDKEAGLADSHGFLRGDGHHAGDMPNVWAHEDGTVKVHYFLRGLRLNMLLDDDGAAVIMHEGADDYISQPSGAAGARIACGALTLAPAAE